jgi:hypothetical protein
MSFSTTDSEIGYLTNGSDTDFEIPFVYEHEDYIKVETIEPVYDPILTTEIIDYITTPLVKDISFIFLDEETIQTIELVLGVPTPLPPPDGLVLRVYRDTADIHSKVYNTYQFPYTTITNDFDQVYQRIQELKRDLRYCVKFGMYGFDVEGKRLTAEEILLRLEALEAQIVSLTGGAGSVPSGAEDGDYLEADSSMPEGVSWKTGVFAGYSARFGAIVDTASLTEALNYIFNFQYTAAGISLSASPAQSVREKGNTISSVNLSAVTTKRTDPIAAVRFYRAGALVNTVSSPTVGGGTETYTDSTPFADTMTFTAEVDDDGTSGGPTTTTSNTVTYTYVYPFYYGVGAASLTGAGIAALTKDIRTNSNSIAVSFSPTAQKIYFAFPTGYGALTSILDPNGFEMISAFTARTVSITGLDATSQTYRVYELTTATTQVAFTCTFIR